MKFNLFQSVQLGGLLLPGCKPDAAKLENTSVPATVAEGAMYRTIMRKSKSTFFII